MTIDAAEELSIGQSRNVDLVVYGSTPGGVVCAVRAAREGLQVELISPNQHPGGMISNGLSTMDTLYNGSRSPLYDEFRESIYDYYRKKYGTDSPQFAATNPGYPKTRYEANVAELLFKQLLEREPNINVSMNWIPEQVDREKRLVQSVTFRHRQLKETKTLFAPYWVDCSYEADLSALARVPYRVGREARSEFQEPHAGITYVRERDWPPADGNDRKWQLARDLELVRYDKWYELIPGASTGEADGAVQAYNMRAIITRDPGNRVPIPKPTNYQSEMFTEFGFGDPDKPGLSMPNQKFGLNHPKLVGRQTPYVEGDWQARIEVINQHVDATLGLLYYRQHDPAVPEIIREGWLAYGLPKDEFPDNAHMPYEIYARETRRIKGRQVFTEHDAQLHPELDRAPIHTDSIGATEWFLDSHACTPRRVADSEQEGKVMMKNETFPGQISYKTLLPEELDNLLVPVCLSSSHVGWGTIRLEPTWMTVCEAAALAIVQANEKDIQPANIDVDQLVRQLADRRFLITFFNDIEDHPQADWYPAVQYLGTQGYFGTYNARPTEAMTAPLAKSWLRRLKAHLREPTFSPSQAAQEVLKAERIDGAEISSKAFIDMLSEILDQHPDRKSNVESVFLELAISPEKTLSRGDAARLIYALSNPSEE
ncbi:FAD dependent oxidoreductase [Polystyrenella longa]|uniref:FAD dependent oxidoreductase n=1 Tax=Polystyrenella longa TaxID=2528007 RepID=A0A518CPR3_9PLAN|nr:FAD-dependent oxidoreductase [Polystyrenella longa]QDU81203.1 FAD dependent oxidoreductase [Polystyrenella longa]